MKIAVFLGVILLIGLAALVLFFYFSTDEDQSLSKIIKDMFSLGPKGCLLLLVIALVIGGIIALIVSQLLSRIMGSSTMDCGCPKKCKLAVIY